MGWRIHRVWSTAWFRDPQGELDAIVAAYEAALAGDPAAAPPPSPPLAPALAFEALQRKVGK